jgi:hypothetical protein
VSRTLDAAPIALFVPSVPLATRPPVILALLLGLRDAGPDTQRGQTVERTPLRLPVTGSTRFYQRLFIGVLRLAPLAGKLVDSS